MDAQFRRRWAWVVLIASFVAYFISGGLYYNVGIYFVLFLDAFQESRTYTSWIGSLLACMFHATGPISSLLLPWIGARGVVIVGGLSLALSFAIIYPANSVIYTMLFFGIFGGMGALCTMSGCLSAIGIYFKKQLYLANGIIGAGGGLGTIVLGILAEYFIDVYGWRGSLLIMSALALQICVSGALIFRLHDHAEDVQVDLDHSKITGEETLPKAEGRLLSRSEPSRHGIGSVSCTQTVRYFRDPRFLGITFATLLMNFSGFSLMLFLKDIMLQRLSSVNYKEFVIWLGSGSVVGRVGAGVISTRLNPFLFYLATSIICAIDIFMLSVAETQWTFHVLGFFFGGCHGIFCVLQAIKIAHIFGRKEMAVLWGYTMSLASIGVLIGPPLGGLIADTTETYYGTLLLYSSSILLSGLLALFVFLVHRNQEKAKSRNNVVLLELRPCLDSTSLKQDSLSTGQPGPGS